MSEVTSANTENACEFDVETWMRAQHIMHVGM